jgi:hypothetical protein
MREIVVIVVVSGVKVLLVLAVNSFVSSGHDGLIVWRCRAASRIRLPRGKDTRCRRKRRRLKRLGNEKKKERRNQCEEKKKRGSSRNDGERV